MAKLTDKQRKKIIAEYVEGGTSQRKLAEKYHVSPYLIRSILNGDKNLAQKISHKKEENTASVLAFMDSKKNDVCGLIDKLLAAMGDEDKLAAATVNQLATAMGIVIDKYTARETPQSSGAKKNNLLEALAACREGVDFSAIPELRPTADADGDMVAGPDVQEQ